MNLIKCFIFFTTIIFLGACGRGFKTVDVQTAAVGDLAPSPDKSETSSDTKNTTKNTEDKKQTIAAISEIWTQDIPNKYDDVGDFFRIKEVPGLEKDPVIDSMPMGNPKTGKTLKLIRGKLRLSQVVHLFDPLKNQLNVTGDVVFDDRKPIRFELSGPYSTGMISLNIADTKSPLKAVFRAKATCSALSEDQEKGEKEEKASGDFCKKLTIDFYYRDQDTFYTDQLISKAILYEEIKRTDSIEPIVPDIIFENIPDENLSDYEKNQKKGFRDGTIDPATLEELPYYFVEPSIDDVASLYPDVSREIEEQKKTFFKTKKKIKAVPNLTGDEKIPEKDPVPIELPDFTLPTTPKSSVKPVPTSPKIKIAPIVLPKPMKIHPNPPVMPPPKPPLSPRTSFVDSPPNSLRPVDQAWGKPHTGKYSATLKKILYLTRSNSILEASQKLGTNAGFTVRFPTRKRHYGTYDMVEMVVNLGEWVKQNTTGINLVVSDTAAANGGRIGNHESHKTGMDIDLAYLTRNPKMVFMRMDVPNKNGYTHTDFAAAEQWQLMKTAHEVSAIEVIYVNRNIKNEMCKQALKAGDLKSKTDTRSEAARVLTRMIVIDSNHGDHWHLRLDCTALKGAKLQTKCISHPQPYVGPECKNVKL